MIGRIRHLPERRLLDYYLAEERGESIDPPVAEHLVDCEACDARYAGLVRFMRALRVEADAEADGILTPERLAAQRQQIARRIGVVGRPARVISFPSVRGASGTPRLSRLLTAAGSHPASAARGVVRWIYAAAAAGVVLGIGLGTAYQWDWTALQDRGTRPIADRGMRGGVPHFSSSAGSGRSLFTPADTIGVSPASEASDDAFLSDLEVALERPRTRELQPFDTLTPHVREISDRADPARHTWN
jgi:hypothetical protein